MLCELVLWWRVVDQLVGVQCCQVVLVGCKVSGYSIVVFAGLVLLVWMVLRLGMKVLGLLVCVFVFVKFL